MGISYKVELNKVMMSKDAKKNYVEEMKNFTDKSRYDCYQGLNVNELDALRKELREKGIYLKLQKIELQN